MVHSKLNHSSPVPNVFVVKLNTFEIAVNPLSGKRANKRTTNDRSVKLTATVVLFILIFSTVIHLCFLNVKIILYIISCGYYPLIFSSMSCNIFRPAEIDWRFVIAKWRNPFIALNSTASSFDKFIFSSFKHSRLSE